MFRTFYFLKHLLCVAAACGVILVFLTGQGYSGDGFAN